MSGCGHYNCNVDIQAFCCKEFFPCRLCHDTAKNEEEKDPKKRHAIDRYLIEVVRCRSCQKEQAPEQNCNECGIKLSDYFCRICRLYDDLSKKIYHCEGCNICRRGPMEDFFHCYGCEACLAISQRDSHTCVAGVTKRNCVICQENLFYSRKTSIAMKCGHYIHNTCLNDMIENQHYKCPLCLKLVVNIRGRDIEMLDKEINETPMPEEFRDMMVDILCNECGAKGQAKFHVFGLKCSSCGNYNTTRC